MEVITDNLDLYWLGFRTMVSLSVVAFVAAMFIGTMVAMSRVSPVPPLRVLGAAYVELFRNVPLTVQFILFYFGLTKVGIKYGAFTSAVIVMAIYTSAFVAETIRSGINSVSGAQAEAARSLGLGFFQTMQLVILPQAFRTVTAPLGSLFIAHTKNTSVALAIGLGEIMYQSSQVNNATARPIWAFIGAAILFVMFTFPAGLAVGALQRRVAIKR